MCVCMTEIEMSLFFVVVVFGFLGAFFFALFIIVKTSYTMNDEI